MTTERKALPRIFRGSASFVIWDVLDSNRGWWYSHREIYGEVAERIPDVTEKAIDRALWRLARRGIITYRIGRGDTLAEYQVPAHGGNVVAIYDRRRNT